MAYIALVGLFTFLIHGFSRVVAKLSRSLTVKRPLQVVRFRQAYYYSSIIALAPVMLIGMQSVGGIGFYEVLLVVVFTVVGCVYVGRRIS